VVLEFTGEIQRYMRLADFFVGKPGPGSLSEAVQQHLPVIVVRNSWTMPQERYNTQWVRENNVGLVLPSFRSIRAAVKELSGRLPQFQSTLRHLHNRAVFEVPQILAQILDTARPAWHQPKRSGTAVVNSGCPTRTIEPSRTLLQNENPSGANTSMVEPC
jgi:1,2-diacylglycerol 3-beta-galactosyltransferase